MFGSFWNLHSVSQSTLHLLFDHKNKHHFISFFYDIHKLGMSSVSDTGLFSHLNDIFDNSQEDWKYRGQSLCWHVFQSYSENYVSLKEGLEVIIKLL